MEAQFDGHLKCVLLDGIVNFLYIPTDAFLPIALAQTFIQVCRIMTHRYASGSQGCVRKHHLEGTLSFSPMRAPYVRQR